MCRGGEEGSDQVPVGPELRHSASLRVTSIRDRLAQPPLPAGACSRPGGENGYTDQGFARYTIVFLCLFVFEKKVL